MRIIVIAIVILGFATAVAFGFNSGAEPISAEDATELKGSQPMLWQCACIDNEINEASGSSRREGWCCDSTNPDCTTVTTIYSREACAVSRPDMYNPQLGPQTTVVHSNQPEIERIVECICHEGTTNETRVRCSYFKSGGFDDMICEPWP